jgi:hypothetical protein
MKVSRILLIAAVTVGMTACDEDAQFDKELYKKVINVLSVENLTFSVNHDLNQEVSTGYQYWLRGNEAYRSGCNCRAGTR